MRKETFSHDIINNPLVCSDFNSIINQDLDASSYQIGYYFLTNRIHNTTGFYLVNIEVVHYDCENTYYNILFYSIQTLFGANQNKYRKRFLHFMLKLRLISIVDLEGLQRSWFRRWWWLEICRLNSPMTRRKWLKVRHSAGFA